MSKFDHKEQNKPISDYLERHKITQAAFGNLLNTSQGMVNQWVTGRRPVSLKMAVAIEKATNGEVTAVQLQPDVYELVGEAKVIAAGS